MTADDQARVEEIERRLNNCKKYPAKFSQYTHGTPEGDVDYTEYNLIGSNAEEIGQVDEEPIAELLANAHADERFLLDLARTADAMLRDAFLSHGLDADALIAAAEQRAAMRCREIAEKGSASTGGVVADAIAAAFNLPPLEDAGR